MRIALEGLAAFGLASLTVAPALIAIIGTCKPWKRKP